ncbi:MAG: N-6 DNA methylase [Candidatus Nitrosocosmicus sp.]
MAIISLSELEQYLWKAANILRGPIDKSDFKSYIVPLLFFKRLSDVYDEQYSLITSYTEDANSMLFVEQQQFVIPTKCHWNDIRKTTKDIGLAIQYAFTEVEKSNPNTLLGIFGDVVWTNKDRLSDELLHDLIRHFSTKNLSNSNVSPDILGQAYEFLIKKFADLSKNKAGEFYTPREVIQLIIGILKPQERESIYDPTCGSGGMLLEAHNYIKNIGRDHRTLKLYGQEKNLTTSSIARINLFLHSITNFRIERGDTLRRPAFVENGRLKKFDVVLANPPYSIKKWNREAWENDVWKRNIYGTHPQGNADYAFFQHIICSLNPKSGRCAILWPHGVLFRETEEDMRTKLVEDDIIDAIIGLGENLFYNSVMESCIIVCRTSKPMERKGKILFINGVNEVTKEKKRSFLSKDNIKNLYELYTSYKNVSGLSYVASLDEIRSKGYSLNVAHYIQKWIIDDHKRDLDKVIYEWQNLSHEIKISYNGLIQKINKEIGKT